MIARMACSSTAFLKATRHHDRGIEKYLAPDDPRDRSCLCRKLVQAFGVQVFDVIEAEPHRLREVAGIGPKRADGLLRLAEHGPSARS